MIIQETSDRRRTSQNDVNVYLVEPTARFSEHMSMIRQELRNKNIPFHEQQGFEKVKELINDKYNKNIVIINNDGLKDNQIPSQVLMKQPNLQIYCYPDSSLRFKPLMNIGQVMKKIQQGNNNHSKIHSRNQQNNKIRMKSVKKAKQNKTSYDRVLVYGGDAITQDFRFVKNYLCSKDYTKQIRSQNQLGAYKKGPNSLLITDINSVQKISNFMNEERLDKKIDLAVLGVGKQGALRKKNMVLATENPIELIDYLKDSGLDVDDFQLKRIPIYPQNISPIVNNNYTERTEDYSLHNVKSPNENRQSSHAISRIIADDIPMARVMQSRAGSEQFINQGISNGINSTNLIASKFSSQSQPQSQKKKPKKIKSIKKKMQSAENLQKLPIQSSQGEFILDNQPVYKSEIPPKKSLMNWAVYLPDRQQQFKTVPQSEYNQRRIQVDYNNSQQQPESPNKYLRLDNNPSLTSIKHDDRAGGNYLPNATIHEVSDEYRGSNRQSYIDEHSRNLKPHNNSIDIRNNIEQIGSERMKKRDEGSGSFSELKSVPVVNSPIKQETKRYSVQNQRKNPENRLNQQYERAKYQMNNVKPNNDSRTRIVKQDKVAPSTYYQNQTQKSIQIQNQEDKKDNYHSSTDYMPAGNQIKVQEKKIIGVSKKTEPAEYISSYRTIQTEVRSNGGRALPAQINSYENISNKDNDRRMYEKVDYNRSPQPQPYNYNRVQKTVVKSANTVYPSTYKYANNNNNQVNDVKEIYNGNKASNIKYNNESTPSYRYGNNLNLSRDKDRDPSLNNSQHRSKIIDNKSIDLEKYERTVDPQGRVVYIPKGAPKSIESKYVPAPVNTQSQYTSQPSNNIQSSRTVQSNYITRQAYPSSHNITNDQNRDKPSSTRNYQFSSNRIINNYNSSNTLYSNAETNKPKYVSQEHSRNYSQYEQKPSEPDRKIQGGVKTYTKQEYIAKYGSYPSDNSKDKRVSLNYASKSPAPQVKQAYHTDKYINTNYQSPKYTPSSQTLYHNTSSAQTIVPKIQDSKQEYKPDYNNHGNSSHRVSNATYRVNNQQSRYNRPEQIDKKQTERISPYASRELRYSESASRQTLPIYSPNEPRKIQDGGSRTRLTRQSNRYAPRTSAHMMGYESRSSSNSSGVLPSPAKHFTSPSAEYDRRVIKQSSKIIEKENSRISQPKIKEQSGIKQNKKWGDGEKQGLPFIYVHNKHRNINYEIDKKFPNKYNIRYFGDFDEVPYDRDAIVMLHPEIDYTGVDLPVREFDNVYVLGYTSKVPNGTIRIDKNDLQYIL